MKSIAQFNQEKDTKSLISSFTKLIGLGDLSKKVNFKRHSLVSLLYLDDQGQICAKVALSLSN